MQVVSVYQEFPLAEKVLDFCVVEISESFGERVESFGKSSNK